MEKHTDWGTRLKNCIKWNEHSDLGCLLLSIFTAAAFNMDMEIVSDEFMSQITNAQTHIAQLCTGWRIVSRRRESAVCSLSCSVLSCTNIQRPWGE